MTWKWRTRPKSVINAFPDSTVEIVLDIDIGTQPPDIQWDASRLESGVQIRPQPDDPRKVWVAIPPNHTGVCRISYRIEGNPPALGMIHVQILPSYQAVTSTHREATPTIPTDMPVDVTVSTPAPADTTAPTHGSVPMPETSLPTVDARVFADKQVPTGQIEHSDLPSPPMLPHFGAFCVEVWKHGQNLPELSMPVLLHRTLSVGRYSLTQQHRPDIDLSRQFDSDDDESLCSRRQAEIFWSAGAIVIRNTGTNPLQRILPDGTCRDIQEVYSWQPGESIVVPGGLVLQLVKHFHHEQ